MGRKKSTSRPGPVTGVTLGPDKKGRFWINLPNSGKPLLFHSGIPGETVLARRGKKTRRGEQGDLLQVVRPHPKRREARCVHFGVCGGCTMQQMPEDYALQVKTRPLYQALAQAAPEAAAHPPVSSPQSFAYRTKIELSFLREGDGVTRLGFHRRGRFDKLVDVGRCWLSSLPSSTIAMVREWAARHGLVGWNARGGGGDLRYLLYRKSSSSDQDLMALVLQTTAELRDDARRELAQLLGRAGISGVTLLWQSSVAGAIVPDGEEPLFGPQTWIEKLGPLEFELGWRSFYQVNPPAYQRLLDTMRAWRQTPPGGRVLDLFCGVGSIGLYLYQPGDRLTGVEVVEQAVIDARNSALRNNIPAHFESMAAEEWQHVAGIDLLLLDPPRSGCHPKLLRELRERAPADELFYISCNPHRLMEELPELLTSYELLAYQAFDFFPQTHHVELLLHFRTRS